MGPAQAIKSGFLKSFQFSGRASRSEFWWFAPVALLLPIITAFCITWSTITAFNIWPILPLAVSAIPFFAAGSRRLQDTDTPGHQILFPIMPLVILWVAFYIGYWLLYGSAFTLTMLFSIVGIFLGTAILGIGAMILIPAIFISIFASFTLIGPTIGQLIVPSDDSDNVYGPNPTEVPS